MNEPYSNPEIEAILDHCLVEIMRGEQTIAGCLEQYPQYAADLKPALEIGLLAVRLKSPEMPQASMDALEKRLLLQAQAQFSPRVVRGQFMPLGKLAAMIAVVILCLLGAGGGTVAASANTVPGDTLYGVKRMWEAIILLLSPLTGELDDLWLRLAETRLDEVEQLAQQGELTDEALIELYHAMAQSIALADDSTTPQVVLYLGQARDELAAITAPDAIIGVYNQVVGLTDARVNADGQLQAPTVIPAETVVTPTATVTPSLTMTPSPTLTALAGGAVEESATPRPTETLTPSPRVPETATRTPTITVTPTATLTPSITPTWTWTPLPLPVLPTLEPNQPLPGTNPDDGSPGGRSTPVSGTADATARFRETQQSVFQTQTAQPPMTTAP